MEFHTSDYAADLRRRSDNLWCEFAEAQQRSALAQYEKAIQTGFRDVSDALVAVPANQGDPHSAGITGDRVAGPKALAYMRYQGGVDTMLNALSADQDLFVAELSLAQSRRDEFLALVQLYRALGGRWQE